MKFTEFNLKPELIEAISYMGFENATPIQEQAIPKIINDEDLIILEPRCNHSSGFVFDLEELKRNGKDNYFWSYITMPV